MTTNVTSGRRSRPSELEDLLGSRQSLELVGAEVVQASDATS
jgi:hypothetical protein